MSHRCPHDELRGRRWTSPTRYFGGIDEDYLEEVSRYWHDSCGGVISPDAHASYVIGLTQSDIDDVADYYDMDGPTKGALESIMTAPFDCDNFGDLCDLMGEDYAQDWLLDIWTAALEHVSVPSLKAGADAKLVYYEEKWLEDEFPSGIPANSSFWGDVGPGGSPFGECDWDDDDAGLSKVETYETTSGSYVYRLQVRAWWVSAILYNSQGGTSRTYRRLGTTGNFPSYPMQQGVDVNLSHTDSGCGEICSSESDSATMVRETAFWSVATGFDYRYVNATANFTYGDVSADNTTPGAPATCN